jgi:hypothetical protein
LKYWWQPKAIENNVRRILLYHNALWLQVYVIRYSSGFIILLFQRRH